MEHLPYANDTFDTIINTMALSGYPGGDKALPEFKRVLTMNGSLLLVDFVYPEDGNFLGMQMTAAMARAEDVIRDIDSLLSAHGFSFRREEAGGFGSVCLYIAQKNR
ncbi:MAG: hypothetical protein QF921_01320 [Pseudomonadales bacterium]|nr:hypothetical protein [Pseudomonadales bacterium]MDP6472168.1 hypothetical protein [Pseudomonadales bacterium]MDP6826580.1 hypothetical protein [Pseudomonadales bacterium]MDP6970149.1 hypothetical protein [Pseudomonadales bacterium]